MEKNIMLFISIIVIIVIYDHIVLNVLEKMTNKMYFDFDYIKRPNDQCESKQIQDINCVGMPSGHTQSITLLSLLLYNYGFISLPICVLLITVISLERVVTKMHTCTQVIVGILIGLAYSGIYISNDLSRNCIFYIGCIKMSLVLAILYKVEQNLSEPIPNWVDKEMYTSIENKKNVPFYMKFIHIVSNIFTHGPIFLSWKQLEQNLDILIDKINQSGIKFDAVVGIKTGGAILSDYVSQKLNLPNYKMKPTKSKYNCNKQSHHTTVDLYDEYTKNKLEYTICEGINDNLEGKNIILIDEMVCSGGTMNACVNYLKSVKKANIVFPTSITFSSKDRFNYDFDVSYISKSDISVYPWGYDN
jgi:hypoxanthine phosphoribosyltransferase